MPATALEDDDAAAAAAAAALTSNRLLATTAAFFFTFLGLLLPAPPALEVATFPLFPVFFAVDSPALSILLDFFFGNITISLSWLFDLVAILFCPLAFREAGGDRLDTCLFASLSTNVERFRRLDNGVIDLRRPPACLGPRLESGEFEILLLLLLLLDLDLGVPFFRSNNGAGEEGSEGEVSEVEGEERCRRPRLLLLLLPRRLLSSLPMLSRLLERRRFRSLLLRSIMYRTSYRGKSNLRPSPDLKFAR